VLAVFTFVGAGFARAVAALPLEQRLPDGGLPYAETNLSALIKEPWNTASLAPFLSFVVYWAWRLRWGRPQGPWCDYPFLSRALPLVALSLVGGVLYHATRSARLWLILDGLPIGVLVLAVAWQQWWLATGRSVARATLALLLSMGLAALVWAAAALPLSARINLNYATLGAAAVLPLLVRLAQTRWQHAAWVLAALLAFGAAVAFRALDYQLASVFPMGTHFLWHLFGGLATWMLAFYLYYSRRDELALNL